ncbi:MAG: hypothetical protein ACOYEQ_01965 [Bacillota bacterium]
MAAVACHSVAVFGLESPEWQLAQAIPRRSAGTSPSLMGMVDLDTGY